MSGAHFVTVNHSDETVGQTKSRKMCLIPHGETIISTKQCMLSRPFMMDAKMFIRLREREGEQKNIEHQIDKSRECIRRFGFLVQQLNERMFPCGKTRFYAV